MKSIIITLFIICSLVSQGQAQGQAATAAPPPRVAISGSNYGCSMPFNAPPNAGGCSNAVLDISLVGEFFQMSCGGVGSCAGSTMNFNVNTKRIGKMECSEQFSCYKTDIFFNGLGQVVTVDYIKCAGPGACNDMNIYLNNADIGKLDCDPDSCQGCTVWENGAAKSCAGW
eukprot:336397_1